ncbi:hypothetical protein QQF64_035445 [Cirrhinus molitorella]|uniref:Uncharacterized protein n=1 Tax=Cirrhinus molitorella TaxID=172907 RepID=A0ABR3NFU3_9TELE
MGFLAAEEGGQIEVRVRASKFGRTETLSVPCVSALEAYLSSALQFTAQRWGFMSSPDTAYHNLLSFQNRLSGPKENGVADSVKARGSNPGLSADLETMATDSQEPSSPEARWPICTPYKDLSPSEALLSMETQMAVLISPYVYPAGSGMLFNAFLHRLCR